MGTTEAESMLALVDRWLTQNDTEAMKSVTRNILEQEGKKVDSDSVDYKLLSRSI